MLPENGDVIKIDTTVSIQNGGQTLPSGFNFAFSKWILRCSVDGRK